MAFSLFRAAQKYAADKKAAQAKKKEDLDRIKSELKKRLLIPPRFKYLELSESKKESKKESKEEIILNSCGHLFSVSEAKVLVHCPEDKTLIKANESKKETTEVSLIVSKLKHEYTVVQTCIDKLNKRKEKGREAQLQAIATFNSKAKALEDKFIKYLAVLSDKNELKLQFYNVLNQTPRALIDPLDEEPLTDPVLTHCGHVFSSHTLQKVENCKCPICRKDVTEDLKEDKQLAARNSPSSETKEHKDSKRGGSTLKSFQFLSLEPMRKDEEITEEQMLKLKAKTLVRHFHKGRDRLTTIQMDVSLTKQQAEEEIKHYNTVVAVTIDSLNECQEEMRLLLLKKELTDEVKEASSFVSASSISCIFDSKIHPSEFVLNARYSILSIKRYRPESFIEHERVGTFVDSVRESRATLLNKINDMKDVRERQTIQDEIKDFKHTQASNSDKLNRELCNAALIDNLKIDALNPEHLQFWHARTSHCWHGYGGVEMIYLGQKYRIPTRVRELMRIAGRAAQYASHHDFYLAIEEARLKRASWWNNPFAWVTRLNPTTRLYSDDTNISIGATYGNKVKDYYF